jgi:carbamoyl-phosphate synthase large subunit
MPKRTDLKRIMIIGSGPIVIGQACEFDYSGTQACKALTSEGYQVVLVNSNPATIMTDPDIADRTYIEPLTLPVLTAIIERERPDALLPTVGGQTGLNCAVELAESGVLQRFGVELIGAKLESIRTAENRLLFKEAMQSIGLDLPKSGVAHTIAEAWQVAEQVGFPAIIRPAFTLGGSGSGISYGRDDFAKAASWGLQQSPICEILIEESVIGWKEFELEVMRDLKDNFVVICSIENLDPMGIHTGDSITVAPAQTLTDKEYQRMRDWARRIISRVGVETGGSNIQFAIHPQTGRMVVIEMNPRVSRSSALASKATGFPIAKIAAKLAVGYALDELPNEITRATPASFEPTIDYVVVKVPRWTFEKFPGVDRVLNTQMKSVGETMAIGRTFKEALQKGVRSLEIGRAGLGADGRERIAVGEVGERLAALSDDRIFAVYSALQGGVTEFSKPTPGIPAGASNPVLAGGEPTAVNQLARHTGIDPWFLRQIEDLALLRRELERYTLDSAPVELLRRAKRNGFSDIQLAFLWQTSEDAVRTRRKHDGVVAVFNRVDTCGAEFRAFTPYLYSTYESECEADPSDRRKVMILGGGPNRIGQGIEFDYCCCHASFALRSLGFETIMVNCNPETVSTDYDTSDRLYFEPVTFEDVLNIVEKERPEGVIVQFGGQTPLNLTARLHEAGVPILGTPPESIDLAEDRERFGDLLTQLGIPQAQHGVARSPAQAHVVADVVSFPILVRPSYVLGGRAMAIVYDHASLDDYMEKAVRASPERPVLIDHYLEDAYELDIDAVSDGKETVIGAVMQHIEEAGIHSGDSACVIPPYMINQHQLAIAREYAYTLARELRVVGLINIQLAIKDGIVYVLEVNPRASRSVPYVSKAIGVPLATVAAQVMVGKTLRELGIVEETWPRGFFVKEVVLPFVKFAGADTILGPEMKSTGEVMGIGHSFGAAFAKAQEAAGSRLPDEGAVLISVNDRDKGSIVKIARDFAALGFRVLATRGTAQALQDSGLKVEAVLKVSEGSPNVATLIMDGHVDLVINTPFGKGALTDGAEIRRAALARGIPYTTTLSAAAAAAAGIRAQREEALRVTSLQEIFGRMR